MFIFGNNFETVALYDADKDEWSEELFEFTNALKTFLSEST